MNRSQDIFLPLKSETLQRSQWDKIQKNTRYHGLSGVLYLKIFTIKSEKLTAREYHFTWRNPKQCITIKIN